VPVVLTSALTKARSAKKRRRTVVIAAAATVVLLAVVLAVTLTSSGLPSGETYVDGNSNAVLYSAGHRAQVPDFAGTSLTGTPLRFADYRGKVVVMNFWGSWCPPCRSEGPTLAAVSAKYLHDGVSFLGVDENDTPANAKAFELGAGITYPSLNDPGYLVAQDIGSAIPINDTPTTLVIDGTGHVAGAIFGAATYSVLETILRTVVVPR